MIYKTSLNNKGAVDKMDPLIKFKQIKGGICTCDMSHTN